MEIDGGRGVNIWHDPQAQHEQEMRFYRLHLDLSGFGS